jgi:GTP-binding protein HflX
MKTEKAILVHLSTSTQDKAIADIYMEELKGLVQAAGAEVIKEVFQIRSEINPKYYIGEGKVNELRELIEETKATCVIFDHNLSPIQQRHLEEALEVKVLDRTQIILDIFAQRALSKEGKLQVELAQLNYLLPRLSGKGQSLSRLGGGIGTRGPGEKKLEEDRRRIKDKITRIKRDINRIQRRRQEQRKSRQKYPMPTVSLVGYTNAGKTTLFNALTRANRLASPKLFATLDPTLRRVTYADGVSFFLSDTVGFIRNLPFELISAFKATLEEVKEAACLLHVIDISSPHCQQHTASVEKILEEIGVVDIPIIKVFNKIDLLPDGQKMRRLRGKINQNSVYVSAHTGEGLDDLKSRLRQILFHDYQIFHLRIPIEEKHLADSFSKWSFVLQKKNLGEAIILRVFARNSHILPFLPYLIQGETN